MKLEINKDYIKIIGIILLIFTISANIAWLNPRPDFCIKTNKDIPIMWQYNKDSGTEFLSAANFPSQYKIWKTRINRPTYPATVKLIGETIGLAIYPFYKMDNLEKGFIGYVLLKIFIYLLGAILMYKLLLNWFENKIVLLTVAITFFHPFSIEFISTFHTTELQFITPIVVLFSFFKLSEKYSHSRNFILSILLGVLMLAKQNYALYFAILLFVILVHQKYKAAALSFISHFIPLILWLIFLKIYGLEYYNHEAVKYNQGTWLFNDLIFRNPIEIIQAVLISFSSWFKSLVGHFSVFFILAIFAFSFANIQKIISKNLIILMLLFLFMSWAQTFAAMRYVNYMTADMSIVVYPLATYVIVAIFQKFKISKLLPFLLFLYLLINIITFVNIPWQHPYNQQDYLDTKKDKVIEFSEK